MKINISQDLYGTVLRVDTIDGKVTSSTSSALQYRKVLNRTWARTPDYWGKRQRGERVPVNGYTYYREKVDVPVGSWSYIWIPNGNRNDYSGPWPAGFGSRAYLSTPQNIIDYMNSELNAKMLEKIKGEKVNLANAVAEIGQTTDMIATTARKIASCVTNLKRGRFLRAAQDLGVPLGTARIRRANTRYNRVYPKDPSAAAANGWLALHFGVEPLLSDIYGSCEAIANWQYEKKAPIRTSRVRKVHVMQSRESPPGDFTTTYETRTTIKYCCSYRVSNETYSRLTSIGLTNPLSPAWEVAPWSFVVDWFLPVGRWLNNLDALVGIDFIDASWTRVDEQTISMFINSSTVSGSTRYIYHLSGETSLLKIQRNSSSPPSVLALPKWKSPFSTTHAVTALALLRQVCR